MKIGHHSFHRPQIRKRKTFPNRKMRSVVPLLLDRFRCVSNRFYCIFLEFIHDSLQETGTSMSRSNRNTNMNTNRRRDFVSFASPCFASLRFAFHELYSHHSIHITIHFLLFPFCSLILSIAPAIEIRMIHRMQSALQKSCTIARMTKTDTISFISCFFRNGGPECSTRLLLTREHIGDIMLP